MHQNDDMVIKKNIKIKKVKPITKDKKSLLKKTALGRSHTGEAKKKKVIKKIVKKTIKKAIKKISAIKKKSVKKSEEIIKLKKASHNPIIKPRLYSWESKATFNPSAFSSDGKIYIVYRAIGDDDLSVIGYATTNDGFNIEDRHTYCIYKRHSLNYKFGKHIIYSSGGGFSGGCEDPRLTLIGDTVYMIYTAFDGWGSVRIALTSIKLSDFKKNKWKWERPVLISPPNEINKNWVLFPEKINGKFAIIHSFYPKILIDYFDDLHELDGVKFIKSDNTRPVDHNRTWDSWFRGIGPAPIKTKDGWLILYHAMDHKNSDRYKMGAMLLDLNDPTKILYRSKNPILEPEEDYENNGHKWGVVYSCGAVVKQKSKDMKETLFVYYGGADKFVCVASIPLDELLKDLKTGKTVKLKK